ncbi:MAG: hypothetical protein ISR83_08230 [Candidatus Marinimicrobia bacterium]|nr:hypothetical protein [Candidatus Neomarinimicrobiota bacterium]
MKHHYIFIFLSIMMLSNCVDPPEYDDGLLDDIPAIVNETDFFSLALKGEKFTSEESWDLIMVPDTNSILHTTLRVDYTGKATDSSFIHLTTETDTVLMAFLVSGSGSIFFNDTLAQWTRFPRKVIFNAHVFSGSLDYQIIKK